MAAHAGVQPSSTSTIIDLTNIHSNIKGTTYLIELSKSIECSSSKCPLKCHGRGTSFCGSSTRDTKPIGSLIMMRLMINTMNLKMMPLFDGNGWGMTKTVMTSTIKSSSSHSCKGARRFKQCNSHWSVAKPLEKFIFLVACSFSSSHNEDDNNHKEFNKDQDNGHDLGGWQYDRKHGKCWMSGMRDDDTGASPCPSAVRHLIIIIIVICTLPLPPNALVAMTQVKEPKHPCHLA